jgi:hypothetical protein
MILKCFKEEVRLLAVLVGKKVKEKAPPAQISQLGA